MRNPINEVQQLHLLTEIAAGFSALQSPDLQKKIQDAFGLEESEKAKAVEARAIIAQADKTLADIVKQRKEVSDAADLKAAAEAQAADNKAWEGRLSDKEKELTDIAKAQEGVEAGFVKERKSLDDYKSQLEQENSRLIGVQADLDKTAQELKDKANKARDMLA